MTASAVYVVGNTAGAFPGQVNRGSVDVFVRKFDLSGKEVWTQQLGTAGDDNVTAAAADATGLYITGHTTGAFPGFTNAGDYDVFIMKLSL